MRTLLNIFSSILYNFWTPPPFGINLIGYFQSEKGVGAGARAIAAALKETVIPFALVNFQDAGSANIDQTFTTFEEKNRFRINLIHLNADSFLYYKEVKGKSFLKGHYNIGFWNWELASFPKQWAAAADYLHEIWVPSTHTLQAVQKSVRIPVKCIPYPVNVPKTPPEGIGRRDFNLPENKKIFLFAFDFNSLAERKNPKAVIRAFLNAFDEKDDALLLIKTVHGKSYPSAMQELAALSKGKRNIQFMDAILSRAEMYALTCLCDAFVSLHRCEGFGLHLFEAMGMGKPVIATGYSSNVDHMNETNSFLVDYRLVPLDRDYGPYKKGEVWADADAGHAAGLMRWIYEQPENGVQRGKKAAMDIDKALSLRSIGSLIEKTIGAIDSTLYNC